MIIKKKKTPGEKFLSGLSLENKHLICAIGGIMLFSFGLCLFSEASHLKHNIGDSSTWIALGTLSLILINSGLSFFGRAVTYRTEIIVKGKYKDRQKKFNNSRPSKKKGPKQEAEKKTS